MKKYNGAPKQILNLLKWFILFLAGQVTKLKYTRKRSLFVDRLLDLHDKI